MAAEVQKLGRDVQLSAVVERYDVVEGGSSDSTIGQGLAVLKARISVVGSGQHVEYTLRVLHGGKEWSVKRRFNEVVSLHEVLKKRLHSLPEPPGKSMVRQFSVEYLEARKAGLNAYLGELCRRRDVLNCKGRRFFLACPSTLQDSGIQMLLSPSKLQRFMRLPLASLMPTMIRCRACYCLVQAIVPGLLGLTQRSRTSSCLGSLQHPTCHPHRCHCGDSRLQSFASICSSRAGTQQQSPASVWQYCETGSFASADSVMGQSVAIP